MCEPLLDMVTVFHDTLTVIAFALVAIAFFTFLRLLKAR